MIKHITYRPELSTEEKKCLSRLFNCGTCMIGITVIKLESGTNFKKGIT